MIALLVAIGAAAALALTSVRLFVGPTLYDRLSAANTIGVKACLICAAAAVAAGRSDWIDVAIAVAFALLTFNVAAAKFFRAKSFQPAMTRSPEERR